MPPPGDDIETKIQKRLHVSFQPQPPHKSASTLTISPADIRARLGAFPGVSVTALEGFELRNGVGDLRGWGYVTVEGTRKGVGRCECFFFFALFVDFLVSFLFSETISSFYS